VVLVLFNPGPDYHRAFNVRHKKAPAFLVCNFRSSMNITAGYDHPRHRIFGTQVKPVTAALLDNEKMMLPQRNRHGATR
jgi:hypothetical protein